MIQPVTVDKRGAHGIAPDRVWRTAHDQTGQELSANDTNRLLRSMSDHPMLKCRLQDGGAVVFTLFVNGWKTPTLDFRHAARTKDFDPYSEAGRVLSAYADAEVCVSDGRGVAQALTTIAATKGNTALVIYLPESRGSEDWAEQDPKTWDFLMSLCKTDACRTLVEGVRIVLVGSPIGSYSDPTNEAMGFDITS